MGNKLYVGNLPYTVRDEDLQQAFGEFGAITSAKLADGTIATTDLATQTITDIRAGVDLGSRVAKSGDTMTGTLTAPGLVSSGSVRSGATGDNARATGFAIADGTDIGELNRSTQYIDDRMSNCRGYMPNGNCAGNTAYNPPNGNWWSRTLAFIGLKSGWEANEIDYFVAAEQKKLGLSHTEKASKPDLIILAGFLWKFPEHILNEFPNKVINVHPALLPKYGGKGMYGMHVHQAVVNNKENETGITIHYVNDRYDEGAIIFQAKCDVETSDTAEDIAEKIHGLEMKYFPEVVNSLLNG